MASPPAPRPRPRALGIDVGELPTGPANAITDVPGVLVGHVTCWADDPVARTGVTAILPTASLADVFHHPPAAGVAVLNGVGELTGAHSIRELGFLDTPILLTGTPSVGRVYDAVVDAMFDAVPAVGDEDVVAPVVGECNDAWLDDSRARNVAVADGRAAIAAAAAGPVTEGVVGAGTGMITMEFKAGIGTSSRVIDGVGHDRRLVLANFGARRQLRVAGRPVGRVLDDELGRGRPRRRRQLHRDRAHRHPARQPPAHPRRPARRDRAWLGSAASPATAPVTSSARCRPATAMPRGASGSGDRRPPRRRRPRTTCSRRPWRPPRKPCSTPCSSPTPSPAAMAHVAPGLPVERVLELL